MLLQLKDTPRALSHPKMTSSKAAGWLCTSHRGQVSAQGHPQPPWLPQPFLGHGKKGFINGLGPGAPFCSSRDNFNWGAILIQSQGILIRRRDQTPAGHTKSTLPSASHPVRSCPSPGLAANSPLLPHPQENRMMQHTVQALQSELDNLRADNIKLYEKIKFLQSYPGRVSACLEEPDHAEGCLTSLMPLISALKKAAANPLDAHCQQCGAPAGKLGVLLPDQAARG